MLSGTGDLSRIFTRDSLERPGVARRVAVTKFNGSSRCKFLQRKGENGILASRSDQVGITEIETCVRISTSAPRVTRGDPIRELC